MTTEAVITLISSIGVAIAALAYAVRTLANQQQKQYEAGIKPTTEKEETQQSALEFAMHYLGVYDKFRDALEKHNEILDKHAQALEAQQKSHLEAHKENKERFDTIDARIDLIYQELKSLKQTVEGLNYEKRLTGLAELLNRAIELIENKKEVDK